MKRTRSAAVTLWMLVGGLIAVSIGTLSPVSANAVAPTATSPTMVQGAFNRLRCDSYSFTPPATTVCRRASVDRVQARVTGISVQLYSARRGGWVNSAYVWVPVRKRLEFAAQLLWVTAPSGTARIQKYTCYEWTLVSDSGPTMCSRGSAGWVTAIIPANGPARIWSPSLKRFVLSTYRWQRRGGYLALDATLVPAAAVDLGTSMLPKVSPTVTDFIATCAGGTVSARVVARFGASVLLDGETITSNGVRTVSLTPGQSLKWTLRVPGTRDVAQQARCLPSDFPSWAVTRTGTPHSQWYVMAPDLGSGSNQGAGKNYIVVADNHGTPVWWQGVNPERPIGAQLEGNNLVWGETGYNYSYGSTYHVSDWSGRTLSVVGATAGIDHHELEPAVGGGHYAIRYVDRACPGVECVDMSSFGGTASDTLVDGEIVKLDASDNVVWTWKFRDHVSFDEWSGLDSESHRTQNKLVMNGLTYWDINHVNSIEDDGDGLIISARHLDAVYRIRKSDGSIDWKLGGTPTPRSLSVLGADRAPLLGSQHDARRIANGNITVFDNGSEFFRVPRAVELRVDSSARTAEIVSQVSDQHIDFSGCCGSARKVTGGNWVVNWGGTGVTTETDDSGKPLLRIDNGSVFSYRSIPVEPGVLSRSTLVNAMDSLAPRALG
ncbi:MAG: aryl-sulfate sulfotransferase [Actinobacteria bacterium]|nr:aryl-sulfate sulfotransferase [Actinomycetota bacterium]